jgi:hypothetical protein
MEAAGRLRRVWDVQFVWGGARLGPTACPFSMAMRIALAAFWRRLEETRRVLARVGVAGARLSAIAHDVKKYARWLRADHIDHGPNLRPFSYALFDGSVPGHAGWHLPVGHERCQAASTFAGTYIVEQMVELLLRYITP